MASTGMILDGIFGSQAIDSSGEVLSVEGADISDLEEGKGVLNYEHRGAEDAQSNGQEIVGKILTAKKVFKESDCENERQRQFWRKVKLPFIYGICRLYDGAGHEGAKALAAQIRDHHANGEPILVRFSVEGSTLEKDGNTLKRSVIRRVALTLKPCNRTADSGLVEDPHAPGGFEKKPEKEADDILASLADDAKKFEHPGFERLTSSETEYTPYDGDERELVKNLVKLKVYNRIKKAITAGSYDAAPSQLSGGAALQREDVRGHKTKAMNVLRDHLKHDKFDKAELLDALKHELPEASDDFLTHFADIAHDYAMKVRKDEQDDGMPKLDPNLGGGVQGEPRVDRSKEPKGVRPPTKKGGTEMKSGGQLLVTPPGGKRRISLQQHFPDDDLYHAILDPHEGLKKGVINEDQFVHLMRSVHEPWHRAMTHWLPLNAALKEGKVPKGILAKSVIFAAMSPNTSVPKQERYYGYYMDMLNEGKVDPFKPMSEDHIKEFTARAASGAELPKWNRDYYAAHPFSTDDGEGEDEGESEKGELPQIMGLRNSHLLYPYLEHLTAKYKDDTQGIAAEMMDMKAEHNRRDQAVYTDKKEGRTHIHRPELDHPKIRGFGPKLTRYLLGMMGGGNMIVPDRHMVRSLFDLHLDNDSSILHKLQTQVVTQANNEPLLRAVDHNFFMKHPAVPRVLEQFPKHFQGREQQAIFPAFWLHWLAIKPYDQMRGRPSMAFNTDTDHMVFWDSVRDEMIKHGLVPHPLHEGVRHDNTFDFGDNEIKKHDVGIDPWPRDQNHVNNTPVWLKAAGALHALTQRWGEMPALLAFYSHIVPHVMEAEAPAPPVQGEPHISYHPHVLKAESLLIDLKKAASDIASGQDQALREVQPHIHQVYNFRTDKNRKLNRHRAGRFMTAGNHVNILEDYHGDLGEHLSEGPIDGDRQAQIEQLKSSPKHDVASVAEIAGGARPELWEAPMMPLQKLRQDPVFHYHRLDQQNPDVLEFIGGKGHLNGHPLESHQLNALMSYAKNGHAVVRYKRDNAEAIQKMESIFTHLLKSDDPAAAEQVHGALSKLDELVKQGLLEPQHAEALRNHAFKDPMTGHVMGNKFAYSDFRNRADSKGGIHIVGDLHDFKSVNDKYGHEVGDRAISAAGKAFREAMDETVGRDQGKLFRIGGDEFAAHVPTHEHAAAFARALRNKLEAIPPIQGQHRLSAGLGFGVSPEHADQALYEAKKQKYDPEGMVGPDSRKWVSRFTPGAAPSMAHSLVPGFEGSIPLDHSQLHVTAPPPPPSPAPEPEPVIKPGSLKSPSTPGSAAPAGAPRR